MPNDLTKAQKGDVMKIITKRGRQIEAKVKEDFGDEAKFTARFELDGTESLWFVDATKMDHTGEVLMSPFEDEPRLEDMREIEKVRIKRKR